MSVKKKAAKKSYVNRPSQITRRAPTKRLKKRRTKNIARPTKGRFPNPRPLLFIITAKGTGKKMHYDGERFSQRARIKLFKTASAAEIRARALLSKYPVLRGYQLAVEPNF